MPAPYEKLARVIEIISPFKLVIDRGSQHRMERGLPVQVFGLGKMIKDPQTGEDLERIEILRGEGIITHVQQRICTIESSEIKDTYRTVKRKKDPYGFGGILAPETEETILDRQDKPFENPQIGDYVRIL